ncbi:MAG: chemotaxis protein CheB [Gemmobacter sp.]
MSESGTQTGLPVIAIGASAGGLEAGRALLKCMPRDARAAFILILHLDPSHDSMMVDLLARHTGLRVVQAAEGMALRPGVVHVIPPGQFLTVEGRQIHLTEPEYGKSVRLPFDALLRSLARDAAADAACIVLSGTGSDGSLGLADIHAAGGLVIAQDPQEAGYPGMPESAIATGKVAQVLPIGQMAAALDAMMRQVPAEGAPAEPGGRNAGARRPEPQTGAIFDTLLSYVGEHAMQDITLYKRATLERRIARRMALVGLGPREMEPYLAMLKSNPEERAQLSADLLIHVTGFFRDPAVFDHLSATSIPYLLAGTPPDRPLRIWVAGCSTGEEAYSLAMACLEGMEAAGAVGRLQILASDIDPEAIANARAGFYPKEIEACVSPERLARFFVAEDGGWRVTSTLRDVIVFTVADLLSDPPFSRIDLVSCRNVLIYMGPEAQKRIIARCCFALRPGGLLLLGAAEMPGQADGCFVVEDKAARLWRRVGQGLPRDLEFAIGKREEAAQTPGQTPMRRNALADLCRRIVLETYAPAAVLLNTRLESLYMLGPTEKYLKVTQGHPDPGILGMLPKALRARFRTAAADCSAANPVVTVSGLRMSGIGAFDIALHSVMAGTEPLLLACFIDTPRPAAARVSKGSDTGEAGRTRDLEADLEAARNDLSAALRDLEQEVEAHGADAAEALSVNEEFQSTNEELLASKEELQSLNEELTALNGQLQETLERHRTTANDLQNVLYSTDVATLFLDLDLNIRFFTPAARAIFNVIPTDVGRPLADLAAVAADDDLSEDARKVLATGAPLERETRGDKGVWLLRSIQPYRAEGGRVEGVVITYTDITERKRTNAALVAARNVADRATRAKSRFLASASHDLRQPLQSMALLHKLLSRHKRSTEGARLGTLLDQTLNSMTAMLDSMLDVNRIESGTVQPKLQPVPIAPLMQRLADEFAPQCGVKGLKLRWVPCKAWIQTDPQLLEQMLRNLLSNAMKYTTKGGILMGCRRHGPFLTVVICDSGIGVSEADSKAIFEDYHQVKKSPALSGNGLGLGLSIVQRLSHLLDHPIAVRSTVGKGSAFMIRLPVVEAPAEGHTAPAVKVKGPRQTGRILLVEDEAPLRSVLEEVLVKEGHTVIAMSDAREAMAWAGGDAERPDVLLTDFDLRGNADGLQLAQDLPDVLGGTVPTIILTGDISSETMKSIAATPHALVSKPVMPDVLLDHISDLMRKARSAQVKSARRRDAADTSVHVIDDDPMIREALRRLFEAEGWEVVTHGSAEAFLAQPRPEGAACLLVDQLLPGMNGVALITLLRSQGSDLPAVVLTGHGDAATAVSALKAGASDLIEKPASAADLLASVRHALKTANGGPRKAENRPAALRQFAGLTPREREVLARVLTGAPNKTIAADLGINQRTVENHRASVMRKTGATSLPALVRMALAADLQEP